MTGVPSRKMRVFALSRDPISATSVNSASMVFKERPNLFIRSESPYLRCIRAGLRPTESDETLDTLLHLLTYFRDDGPCMSVEGILESRGSLFDLELVSLSESDTISGSDLA